MEQNKIDNKRMREIKGVVYLAISFFLLLCLVSWHPEDPSFTHSVFTDKALHNFTGHVGSYTADSLIGLLGISSILLPVIFLLCSFQYFLKPEFFINKSRFFGFFFFVVSFSGLLAVIIKKITIYEKSLEAGGFIGAKIVELLLDYFNIAGTYILLIMILIISLIFMIEFSLVTVVGKFSHISLAAIAAVKNVFGALTSSALKNIKIEKQSQPLFEESAAAPKKPKSKKSMLLAGTS